MKFSQRIDFKHSYHTKKKKKYLCEVMGVLNVLILLW